MAVAIVMPKAGNSVEECVLSKWRIKVGDTIKIARKTGQQKDVDSNATGRSLLKQQLKYFHILQHNRIP